MNGPRCRSGHGTRSFRPRSVCALILLSTLVGLAGCSGGPLMEQYQTERDYWRAIRLETRTYLQPAPDSSAIARVEAAFLEFLEAHPEGVSGGDSTANAVVLELRARASIKLAETRARAGRRSEAVEALWNQRMKSGRDPGASLAIYLRLLELTRTSPDTTARLLREMYRTLPVVAVPEIPVREVLEAPIERARILAAAGRRDEARVALHEAQRWYDSLATAHDGSVVQVVALMQKADALVRENRLAEAASTLRAALNLEHAESARPKIRLDLALVEWRLRGDDASAAAAFQAIARDYPEHLVAAEAEKLAAQAWNQAGDTQAAVAALDRAAAIHRQKGERGEAAAAVHETALLLLKGGRQEEGLRRLRELVNDDPRTKSGLLAPITIAEHYRQVGEPKAEAAALREAAAVYDRLAAEPLIASNREVVGEALFRLAQVRARQEDWEAAAAALMKIAERFPETTLAAGTLYEAASVYRNRLNDPVRAREVLEIFLRRYPDHPLAGRVEARLNDLGQPVDGSIPESGILEETR